jgi:hypothetical protein
MLIVGSLIIYIVGIVTGIYFVTQIEKDIDKKLKE